MRTTGKIILLGVVFFGAAALVSGGDEDLAQATADNQPSTPGLLPVAQYESDEHAVHLGVGGPATGFEQEEFPYPEDKALGIGA